MSIKPTSWFKHLVEVYFICQYVPLPIVLHIFGLYRSQEFLVPGPASCRWKCPWWELFKGLKGSDFEHSGPGSDTPGVSRLSCSRSCIM
jgi:hypothetical protein